MFSGSTIAGVFLVPLGAVCAWYGWKQLNVAADSRNWPQATGVITSTKLRKLPHDSDSACQYEAVVTYEYTVGGETFSSSTIAVGKETLELTAQASLGLADMYPLHASVPVYHDPADPSRAVLEPGQEPNSVMVVALGIGMVVVGCVLLL